jgi:hypothetical protein
MESYEVKKLKIELQIVEEKLKLFPDNIKLQQKKIELELRLFVLLKQ